jgi:hypothetical protein
MMKTHQLAHVEAAKQGVAFLTAKETAALLRVSPVTLGRWRIQGTGTGMGPPYRKFGRRVVYSRDDLLSWADAQGRASTSDTDFRSPGHCGTDFHRDEKAHLYESKPKTRCRK